MLLLLLLLQSLFDVLGKQAILQKGGDVEDLCLTFSATTTAFGDTKVGDGSVSLISIFEMGN